MKALLIVALIVTGALAVSKANRIPSYSDFDTNGNGKVTQKEFENTQQKRMTAQAEAGRMMRNVGNATKFEDIDRNGDGYFDRKEFQEHQDRNRNRRGKGRGQGRNR